MVWSLDKRFVYMLLAVPWMTLPPPHEAALRRAAVVYAAMNGQPPEAATWRGRPAAQGPGPEAGREFQSP
jgi:hypothetical protein